MSAKFAMVATCLTALTLTWTSAGRAQTPGTAELETLFGEVVTTSVTGRPQTMAESPADLIVITGEDLRRSGARTIADVPGLLLKRYPGIDVQAASSLAPNVGLQGYNAPYSPSLLVLLNGRQVYLDHYGYTAWSTIPVSLADIRQIEIVKGPASALFGYNAASGVINIITRDPSVDQGGSLDVSYGSGGALQGGGTWLTKLASNWGLRLSGGAERADGERDWRAQDHTGFHPDRSSLAGELVGRPTSWARTSLEATYTRSGQFELSPSFDLLASQYRTWSIKGGADIDLPWAVLALSAYHNGLDLTSTTLVGGGGSPAPNLNAEFHNGVTVAQASLLTRLSPTIVLRQAIEFRDNRLTSAFVGNGEIGYRGYAASTMVEWQMAPFWTWTNALRFDRLELERQGPLPQGFVIPNQFWSRGSNAPSFNTGLVHHLDGQTSLRLAVGQAVEAPSLLEFGLISGAPPIFLLGNPTLKPTQVRKYELAINHNALSGFSLGASLFYQTRDDLKSLSVPSFAPQIDQLQLFQIANIGSSREVGFEAHGRYAFDATGSVSLAYTFARIKDSLIQGVRDDFAHGTPRHKVSLSAQRDFGPLEADMTLVYVGAIAQTPATNLALSDALVRVPAYVQMNARLGYRLDDHWSLSLTGEGITQARRAENTGPRAERRVIAALRYGF